MVRKLVSALLLVAAACGSMPANAAQDGGIVSGATCAGKMFNPITHLDWNNLFPITVAGVRLGSNSNPPQMHMPPVCVCPGRFGVPTPGIGVTYWQPLYLAEIERTAGCFRSLGNGIQAMPGFGIMDSDQQLTQRDANRKSTRMQVHWYMYPVFAILELFKSLACMAPSGFNLAYITEVDYTWQDDMWGVVFSPEAVLFANPVADVACAVDATASAYHFPLDALFWCAGTWGSVYPFSGNSNHSMGNFALNNLVMSKFIARQSRLGLMWTTIGPTAMCFSHPSPIWMKSQYRVNQVGPIPRYGRPLVIGGTEHKQFPPLTNFPTQESTVNFIWQGQQCCVRF